MKWLSIHILSSYAFLGKATWIYIDKGVLTSLWCSALEVFYSMKSKYSHWRICSSLTIVVSFKLCATLSRSYFAKTLSENLSRLNWCKQVLIKMYNEYSKCFQKTFHCYLPYFQWRIAKDFTLVQRLSTFGKKKYILYNVYRISFF